MDLMEHAVLVLLVGRGEDVCLGDHAPEDDAGGHGVVDVYRVRRLLLLGLWLVHGQLLEEPLVQRPAHQLRVVEEVLFDPREVLVATAAGEGREVRRVHARRVDHERPPPVPVAEVARDL
eukprot:CAMPEP_0168370906 /NCGR_PEP_ID=MMETSP0228-20121227/7499_1 /TAXON_ID=133427 /ORGANISM="Protoceratium reticulatum, Strain CCCM 535 (=CCMP 1889)" /LENGTH=119 /DNA_ID=CAMNT_0008383781 /DNA_START=133 /DNA_END=489 /DNA_ORIENTATION=+